MSMISEQVADLREKAQVFEDSGCVTDGIVKTFRKAADTIEKLSAKLAINSQPPADLPWIPVSSGILPETGQQIFATCEQEGETDVMEIYYNSELLVPPWRMTAWMPAEPYKGVE